MEEKDVDFYHIRRSLEELRNKLHKEVDARIDTALEVCATVESKYSKKSQENVEKDKLLNEFLEKMNPNILNNPTQMMHWVKATGKSEEELRRLKLEHTKPPSTPNSELVRA
jgi:hypothetical protein